MKFLIYFLLFLSILGSIAAELPCIKDRIKEIGDASLLVDNLGAASDVKARVDSCDSSAPLTLFLPNNQAIINAISRVKSTNPAAGSVGEMNDQQKQLLGALASYHITTVKASTAVLQQNGVSVLNTTMANRPQFVQLGQDNPQRLLVVAKPSDSSNQVAAGLFSLQKNKKYFNGTSKIVADASEELKGPNDAKIIQKDIECKDGYIHVIDKVLLLPMNTTQQLRTSNLTGFAQLIDEAGARDWINQLSGITIFAPTNQALKQLDQLIANKTIQVFAAPYSSFYQSKARVFAEQSAEAGKSKYGNIFSLPKDKLMKLVQAHVFKGLQYSTGFRVNSAFTNYNNTQYYFRSLNKTSGATPKKYGLRSILSRWMALDRDEETQQTYGNVPNAIGDAPIVYANIFTRNGVIHVVNGVLGVNTTVVPKPKEKTTPVPGVGPATIIPASNTTAPSVQATAVGVACVNTTMLSNLANITSTKNITLNTPSGPFNVIINGDIPDCPQSDQLCMVAALTNTCAVPASPFQQGAPTDLVNAKPSEINARHANSIIFTPRCFNPQTHVCVNNHFLCPTSHPSLCGDACYNSQQYKCYAKFSMCPTHAPAVCGEACYAEDQYECQRGTLKQKGQGGK